MLWKQNIIGITESDILELINIVKDISAINKDNNIDDATKTSRIFNTLESYSSVVDDCDIINCDLINLYNNIDVDIKLIKEL